MMSLVEVKTCTFRRAFIEDQTLLQSLWKQVEDNDAICDVTIKLRGNVEVKGHWCVLVSCPYFKALYESGLREQRSGVLDLSIGEADIIKSVIEYIYKGYVKVNLDSVKDILHIADYLQLDSLKNNCSESLQQSINNDNCISMCTLANTYNLDSLYHTAYDRLRSHLDEVLQCEQSVDLTPESIHQLFTDKTLRYVPTVDRWRFLRRWYQKDVDARRVDFDLLFTVLNLKDIPQQIFYSEVCKNEVLELLDLSQSRIKEHEKKLRSGDITSECEYTLLLIACAGFVRYSIGYIVEEDRWVTMPRFPTGADGVISVQPETNDVNLFVTEDKVYDLHSSRTSPSVYKLNNAALSEGWCRQLVSCSHIKVVGRLHAVFYTTREKVCFVYSTGSHVIAKVGKQDIAPDETSVDSTTGNFVLFRSKGTNTVTSVMTCNVGIHGFIIQLVIRQSKGNGKFVEKTRYRRLVYDGNINRLKFGSINCPRQNVGNIMYCVDDKLYLEGIGKRRQICDLVTGKCTSDRVSLPELPNQLKLQHHLSLVTDGHIFIFGGIVKDTKSSSRSSSGFKIPIMDRARGSSAWTLLADSPPNMTIVGGQIVSLKVPKEFVRCDIDCPHCKVYPRFKNRYGYLEEDDDEDDDLYDSDRDSFSEFGSISSFIPPWFW